jgi:two-component system KDP operon response regulator KdpE
MSFVRSVHLTPKEYDTLHYLMANVGRLVTHSLAQGRLGPGHTQSRPYLHVFVGQLGRKIEPRAGRRRLILTEPGVGYRLAEAIEE